MIFKKTIFTLIIISVNLLLVEMIFRIWVFRLDGIQRVGGPEYVQIYESLKNNNQPNFLQEPYLNYVNNHRLMKSDSVR